MKRNKLFDSQGAKGGGLSRKGRKAISSTTTPRLLTISDEDRQKLLSSRVSNILEEKMDDFNLHLQGKKSFDNIPKRLEQYREKDCPLWTKATTLHDHEDDEPHEHQELAFVKQDGPTTTTIATESHCDDEIKMDQDADDSHHCCCCRHKKVENVRSVQEIAIQTEEEVVIVKKFEERGVQTEPESSHVARETSDMEKDEDLMGVIRHEERSFEYLEKSYNYEYNEDMNKCFDKSSESVLLENSFTDKVFANKLIEKSSKKKRRRTWSENIHRVSVGNSSVSSKDSSIFMIEPENINCNEDDGVVATNTNYEKNNDNGDAGDVVMIQDDNNDDGSHNFASWKHSSHDNDDDNKATDVLPLQSVWNTSCDDDFFANLPNDEELFNLPPTSPTGGKRYMSSSTPNLEFHRGQPGIRNISNGELDSPFSSMGLSPVATINSNVNSASKPKKQVRKRSTVLQSKKTITNERDKDRTPTRITKMSKSARPRGKTLRLMNDEINPRATAIGQRNVVTQSQKSGLKASNNLNRTTPPTVSSSQGDIQCSNHTPMLNYSLIDTPILKNELKRYGLKPVPRTKAKILLRHIYKETHK